VIITTLLPSLAALLIGPLIVKELASPETVNISPLPVVTDKDEAAPRQAASAFVIWTLYAFPDPLFWKAIMKVTISPASKPVTFPPVGGATRVPIKRGEEEPGAVQLPVGKGVRIPEALFVVTAPSYIVSVI
jgi:hypothetical protein